MMFNMTEINLTFHQCTYRWNLFFSTLNTLYSAICSPFTEMTLFKMVFLDLMWCLLKFSLFQGFQHPVVSHSSVFLNVFTVKTLMRSRSCHLGDCCWWNRCRSSLFLHSAPSPLVSVTCSSVEIQEHIITQPTGNAQN